MSVFLHGQTMGQLCQKITECPAYPVYNTFRMLLRLSRFHSALVILRPRRSQQYLKTVAERCTSPVWSYFVRHGTRAEAIEVPRWWSHEQMLVIYNFNIITYKYCYNVVSRKNLISFSSLVSLIWPPLSGVLYFQD